MVCMDVDPMHSTRRLVLREALSGVTGDVYLDALEGQVFDLCDATHLEHFDASGVNFGVGDMAIGLADSLWSLNACTLTALHLNGVMQRAGSVEHDFNLGTIVAMLPSTLQHLYLRDNDINDAHLGGINGLVLSGDLEHLEVLDVQGNPRLTIREPSAVLCGVGLPNGLTERLHDACHDDCVHLDGRDLVVDHDRAEFYLSTALVNLPNRLARLHLDSIGLTDAHLGVVHGLIRKGDLRDLEFLDVSNNPDLTQQAVSELELTINAFYDDREFELVHDHVHV